MTETRVLAKAKICSLTKSPSPDFQLPLAPKVPKRRRNRKQVPVMQVPPAELLLDDNATLTVAVGEQAVAIARLGGEEWPLPTELLLLLEPEQQPEVLAEVGLEDLLREHLSSAGAVADP